MTKKKSVWNREKTSRHLSLWQCLREIFFYDCSSLTRHSLNYPRKEEPSGITARLHTHAAHARLYTTQPWWTLMSRHPNAAPPLPHRSVRWCCWLFSRQRRRSHDAVNSLSQSAANSRLRRSTHLTWQPVKATFFFYLRAASLVAFFFFVWWNRERHAGTVAGSRARSLLWPIGDLVWGWWWPFLTWTSQSWLLEKLSLSSLSRSDKRCFEDCISCSRKEKVASHQAWFNF